MKEINRKYIAAYNNRDMAGIQSIFSREARIMPPGHPPFTWSGKSGCFSNRLLKQNWLHNFWIPFQKYRNLSTCWCHVVTTRFTRKRKKSSVRLVTWHSNAQKWRSTRKKESASLTSSKHLPFCNQDEFVTSWLVMLRLCAGHWYFGRKSTVNGRFKLIVGISTILSRKHKHLSKANNSFEKHSQIKRIHLFNVK